MIAHRYQIHETRQMTGTLSSTRANELIRCSFIWIGIHLLYAIGGSWGKWLLAFLESRATRTSKIGIDKCVHSATVSPFTLDTRFTINAHVCCIYKDSPCMKNSHRPHVKKLSCAPFYCFRAHACCKHDHNPCVGNCHTVDNIQASL